MPYSANFVGSKRMRVETSDLLAVFDALDRTTTDIIFGLRDGTLLPNQQIRLGKLFEAVGLLLEAHAAVVLRDIAREKEAQGVPASTTSSSYQCQQDEPEVVEGERHGNTSRDGH